MSDMGRVRGNNEDSFLCAPEAGCFAVADGMGGGDAGEVASATVVECLKKAVESTMLDSPGCRKYAIQQSLHKANGTVVKYRDSHGTRTSHLSAMWATAACTVSAMARCSASPATTALATR